MVRSIIILSFLLPLAVVGQEENESVIRKGLLRAQGTFSFGQLLELEEKAIYLNGNLEYYFSSKISGRGDIYFHLKSSEYSALKSNHQLFSGASFHIPTSKSFNPYLGIQPGIAITEDSFRGESAMATPLISGLLGFNYYAENWFHLFLDVRYVYGVHNSGTPLEVGISEIRLSFGLGFNINTK